jgi:hypothetical protein
MNPPDKFKAKVPWRKPRRRVSTRGISLSLGLVIFAIAGAAPRIAYGQLELIADKEPQRVFAGEVRKVALVWHNPGGEIATADVRARLYQASSATAAPLIEKPWKKIEILPGQTVLESAALDFPAVNAETRFLVQWLADTNRVISKTEVLVYPTNLLSELKPLLGEAILGVLDPNNELKPLLKQNQVDFVDLSAMSLDDFQGKLVVVGPFQTRAQMRVGLARSIQKIARKGAAVVWLQPPPGPKDPLKPSFYIVPAGKGAVIVVQPDLVSRLPEKPQSQLNLLYFCKLALAPRLLPLSEFTSQP